MTQLFKFVGNSGPVLKKINYTSNNQHNQNVRLDENIPWMYGIKVDALDLKITTYVNLGLQSPTEYCFALSLYQNIKAVIFQNAF